jgi:hypothetical protein
MAFQESPNTARTTPAISNLISNVQGISRKSQGEESVGTTRDQSSSQTVIIDATLLENFGNQTMTDPSMLMMDEAAQAKRKETRESPTNVKRQKRQSSEDPISEEFEGHGYVDMPQYEFHWPTTPSLEPLPISVTLPYIRAFANKKFDAPIPLLVPPMLPIGNLHHFPAMLTVPPFFTLPTSIPLYPTGFMPFGFYSYGEDSEFGYSDEESEGEESFGEENEEVLAGSMMHQSNPSHVSPLTTLASLASGTVKNKTQI